MVKGVVAQTPEQREAYEADIFTWRKVIPNGVTVIGTFVGVSAIRFAHTGDYQSAVLASVLAGFIDGLDGPTARVLGATSQFGAELDSLSDLVCFGFSPAMILYLWKLHELGWLGWAVALFFAICMQIRLARFNAGVDFNTKPWTNNFFMGVPAPGGAGLAVIPLVLSFQFPADSTGLWTRANAVAVYTLVVALLLVSKLPTFSSKMMKRTMLKQHRMKFALGVIVTSFLYGIVNAPWLTLIVIGVAYLASLPFSSAYFAALSRLEKKPLSYSTLPVVPATVPASVPANASVAPIAHAASPAATRGRSSSPRRRRL